MEYSNYYFRGRGLSVYLYKPQVAGEYYLYKCLGVSAISINLKRDSVNYPNNKHYQTQQAVKQYFSNWSIH